MTFTTVTDNGLIWESLIGAVGAIDLAEITLKVDEKGGITFRSMDGGHTVLVDAAFPPQSFSKFEISKSEKISIVTEDIASALKRLNTKEPVEVSLLDEGLLKVSGRSKTGSKLSYKLHTIEPYGEDTKLPNITLRNLISIPRSAILSALGDIAVVSDGVRIAATKDLLAIWGKAEKGEANKEIMAGEEGVVLDIKDKSVKCGYSATYLTKFISSQPTDKVSLWLGNKLPIKIDVSVGEGRVTCYVASRIDEMEEPKTTVNEDNEEEQPTPNV